MKEQYEITIDTTKSIKCPDDLMRDLKSLFSGSHINFLLGAGFSYGILNTLGNLECLFESLRVYRSDDISKAKRALILKGYLYWMFFSESVYPASFLKLNDSKLTPYYEFSNCLYKILSERGNPVLHRQCNIFTTNYDPINEIAFDRSKCICNDGFEGRIFPIFSTDNFSKVYFREALFSNRKAEIPSINLVKVHGSVTWKMDDDSVIYQDYKRGLSDFYNKYNSYFDANIIDSIRTIFRGVDESNVDSLLKTTMDGNLFDIKFTDIPVIKEMLDEYSNNIPIVNPTKEKFMHTLLNKNYYELLRIYTNELEKENVLLVSFGFSFRDEHILDLTKRSLINPSLKLLVFCFDKKEVDQYKLRFGEIKNNNISYVYTKDSNLTINEFNTILGQIHA